VTLTARTIVAFTTRPTFALWASVAARTIAVAAFATAMPIAARRAIFPGRCCRLTGCSCRGRGGYIAGISSRGRSAVGTPIRSTRTGRLLAAVTTSGRTPDLDHDRFSGCGRFG
jgi:hypothetical protein